MLAIGNGETVTDGENIYLMSQGKLVWQKEGDKAEHKVSKEVLKILLSFGGLNTNGKQSARG